MVSQKWRIICREFSGRKDGYIYLARVPQAGVVVKYKCLWNTFVWRRAGGRRVCLCVKLQRDKVEQILLRFDPMSGALLA